MTMTFGGCALPPLQWKRRRPRSWRARSCSTPASIFRWLAELLDLAAGQIPILIELKCRGGNAAKLAKAVAAELTGYAGPVGVMSFEPAVGKWFSRHLPDMRRGLVISERASAFDRWRSIAKASPHFLAVDRATLGRAWVAKEHGRRWVYSWTIRTPLSARQLKFTPMRLSGKAMADRESEILAKIATGVSAIPAAQWDALAGASDPFVSHAFLSLLEGSGSVGPNTGWSPLPVLIERDGRTVAAAPAYLKTHSQGEYVFDHGWADAWERAGGTYYPKLQVAVPFTPCPGPRLLGDDRFALLAALETVTVQNGLSSAHITFLNDDEVKAAEARGWLRRDGLQYHWFNRDYSSFDDFLSRLASRKRKAVRRERAAAVDGLEIVTLRGAKSKPVIGTRCGASTSIPAGANGDGLI